MKWKSSAAANKMAVLVCVLTLLIGLLILSSIQYAKSQQENGTRNHLEANSIAFTNATDLTPHESTTDTHALVVNSQNSLQKLNPYANGLPPSGTYYWNVVTQFGGNTHQYPDDQQWYAKNNVGDSVTFTNPNHKVLIASTAQVGALMGFEYTKPEVGWYRFTAGPALRTNFGVVDVYINDNLVYENLDLYGAAHNTHHYAQLNVKFKPFKVTSTESPLKIEFKVVSKYADSTDYRIGFCWLLLEKLVQV